MLGAIIVADCAEESQVDTTGSSALMRNTQWACVDLLGQSVISRVADQFKKESCDAVFVTGPNPGVNRSASDRATDVWDNASVLLANLREEGFETVLIARLGSYVEINSAEMLAFHRERGSRLSRAAAPGGLLDLWMIDPSRVPEHEQIRQLLDEEEPAVFPVYGYVNRLQNAYDYRRLVLDSFSSRCQLRPHAVEVRPGIWMCDGADIARSARVVAPAFIGRDVRVSDECLITRGSNIERNTVIDFGTAVEDSSVLPNSYIGIGLDLAHSIVDGSNLLNLRHNVTLEITDPVVMRHHTGRSGVQSWADAGQSEMAFSSVE